jgi:hypothetical protein
VGGDDRGGGAQSGALTRGFRTPEPAFVLRSFGFSPDAAQASKSFSNQGAWALHKTGFTLTLRGDLGKIASL